ncbi:ABC transporter ATP-binding protein [Marinobacter subterrani]|uniref:ABC-type lipoprotein export system, ATPase component n=1 Tax=Marinobacter subterrani TaxID=1658765 RepID=A0A0J7J3P2_9GAMM|nr:ATP-binding cassette domain-containing protein [Marinobacter subterrani]KMQ73163.1 ABC-type lipoprotein export system, ATPase component [Marinobacter subterrani]
MAEPLLAARGLNKQFRSGNQPVSVLSDLALQLGRGESLALTGRSGSGKSTLLNILCGLEQPDSGRIRVLDEIFDSGKPAGSSQVEARWAQLRRQQVGVVFQEANLMPALSLLDNVRLRARLAGRSEDPCRDWLERLGIGELAGRYPDQVSGGQRQRAALAMVFAMNPALILADEPTGSLDRHTAEAVTRQLFELQARHCCALILATHDAELATRCTHHLDLGHQPEA